MVFCGQPSKACAECRLRRTKCDTKRPSCSQCIRSGRQCTGYRDPADMIFRDESKALLAKRERKAGGKKGRSSPPPSSTFPESTSEVSPHKLAWDVAQDLTTRSYVPKVSLMNLGTSAEDQATCFFFRNYVLDTVEFKNGNFQYLSNIYASEEFRPALADCISALGMAGLANFWKASNIMSKAHTKYNSAIRLVSSMLADIDGAKSDQTLVAVMLLGLYETNTCSGPQSMKSWTKHINGAATLLHLRGKQQLSTPIGRQIFVHLRTQIITNCIQRHALVPETISQWSRIALQYENPIEATATQLSFLGIKFASIRASMSSFNDYSNSANLIASLRALDAEYIAWIAKCPPECLYATVPLFQPSNDVYGNEYHVYSNLWIATLWNHYRCMRILINEILLDQLSFHLQTPGSFDTINPMVITSDFSLSDPTSSTDPTSYSDLLFTATAAVHTLSHDICASVPFFLSSSESGSGSETSSQSPPKSVCGNLLLWPLYTAACTWLVSDEMRSWVASQLAGIAETMGIRQAAPLAQSLTMTTNIDTLEWRDETFVNDNEVSMLEYGD